MKLNLSRRIPPLTNESKLRSGGANGLSNTGHPRNLPGMEPLSESSILLRTDEKVFDRGEVLLASGAILSLAKRGDSLYAKVEGSDIKPYRVSVRQGEDGEVEAECSCPYGEEWGDWCKHIVAVLLAYAHDDDAIEEQPSLEEWLEPYSREQLVELLIELSGRNPALYDEVVAVVTGEEPGDEDEDDWD